ncbi:MAG: isocitrate/isopropylmalate dehydrogenase family protein [Anaerolineales bacterium]|nr:MAG: isocitrate/isopropylmalate dehydrogenase family protein [Anaerolineales bacterium]
MAKYKIAWMPGDGIGIEVMEAARIVLDKLKLDADYLPADIGWEFWRTEGDALPQRTLDLLQTVDCGLFGAITSKPKQEAEQELIPELQGKGITYRSPIVRLRQELQLYYNLRPCKAYPGNPLNYRDNIDLVVFRENAEGEYSGVEFHPVENDLREMMKKYSPALGNFDDVAGDDMAMTVRVVTVRGADRIIRRAFEFAQKNKYPTVTLVEKPNVLRETSGMMVRVAREIHKEFPEIELWETNIDAQMMWMIKNPEDYGVMVTSNLFGDILSDLCAQLVGGLGFASSGNIGDKLAVFEPTHGSAPKHAGKYIANPNAMLLTAKMMLEYLGEYDKAKALEDAIAGVILDGKVRTYDMGGDSSTMDVANAVAERL